MNAAYNSRPKNPQRIDTLNDGTREVEIHYFGCAHNASIHIEVYQVMSSGARPLVEYKDFPNMENARFYIAKNYDDI